MTLLILAVAMSTLMAAPTIMAQLVPTIAAGNSTCPVTLAMDLSRYTGTPRAWTKPDAKIDFQNFVFGVGYERTLISNNMLMVQSPIGMVGSTNSGLTFQSKLNTPLESATLSYDFMFDPGYDWTHGGKLPGLCSDDCPSGCSAVSKTEGFSSRLMFRQNGALESYMYYPDRPLTSACGDDWLYNYNAVAGQWYNVHLAITLNTPGVADGIQKAWINGTPVLDRADVMFRYDAKFQIARLFFANFHGGKSSQFQPNHTEFRNIQIMVGECPPSQLTSVSPQPAPAVATTPPVVTTIPATTAGQNTTSAVPPQPAPQPAPVVVTTIPASTAGQSTVTAGPPQPAPAAVPTTPSGCANVVTLGGQGATGTNLKSADGTTSDADCFAQCQQYTVTNPTRPPCTASVRRDSTGRCWFKQANPSAFVSQPGYSVTYCTTNPAGGGIVGGTVLQTTTTTAVGPVGAAPVLPQSAPVVVSASPASSTGTASQSTTAVAPQPAPAVVSASPAGTALQNTTAVAPQPASAVVMMSPPSTAVRSTTRAPRAPRALLR